MKQKTRIFGSIGASALVALLSLAGINPAYAHDRLVGSNPAANESVPEAPTEIVLEFSGNLLVLNDEMIDEGNVLTVTNEQGETVSTGDLKIEGRTASRPLQPNLANGQYTVVWGVTSSDGHPISDSFQFSIGVPVAVDEQPSPATPEDDIRALETEIGTDIIEEARAMRTVLIALAGAGVAAAIYGLVVVLRKRKKSKTSPEELSE